MSVSELRAESVRIEYARPDGTTTLAVEDISLTVERGEFVSIVGPSGCGKTTFLKTVNGLITPAGGSITLHDQPLSQSARDRAMVFQDASLFPWFTVERNIAYGLECQGKRSREARRQVKPFIDLVGLSGFERHYPYEISGGMQQRANLARALAVEPRVLLMDEPFASLDAQTREMMQSELLDVWSKTNKTVLFITHQIDEAIYLSDRVIVLSARPSRVLADIPIALPRPRSLDVKRNDVFVEYADRVWTLIESQARLTMSGDNTEGRHPDEARI